MKHLQRAAITSKLAEGLRERENWCGETHLQKAVYFLQEMLGAPVGYGFVLYKHGPFSFDLRDELEGMVADGLLRREPQSPPYGPRLAVTEQASRLQSMYPRTLARYKDYLNFVADRLAAKGVSDLERLSTALYVSKEKGGASIDERAEMLLAIKPHISESLARAAVAEVDQIREESQSVSS
jgi:uncharacterized protein YwgA